MVHGATQHRDAIHVSGLAVTFVWWSGNFCTCHVYAICIYLAPSYPPHFQASAEPSLPRGVAGPSHQDCMSCKAKPQDGQQQLQSFFRKCEAC